MRSTRNIGLEIALGLTLAAAGALSAAAQQPNSPKEQDQILRSSPDLQLTPAQKQTIYTSISSKPAKETAPPTFRVAVGETVPVSIELQPLPGTIVDLMPQTKNFQYAMVTNQVLLVDGTNRRIVDIITQ
jgi:glucose/arabinose dehydrogenase